ncbi:MAG: PEP-CTERM sorting domain-containing protein [Planctomycetota bacterium]
MKSLFFAIALCAAFVGTTVEGWAGAYGSSILTTQNVRLQYFNGTNWVNATTTQATVASTSIFSETTATLGPNTVTSGIVSGLNAAQSYTGTAFPPLEGSSVPLSAVGMSNTDSFALGDTFGTGSTIIGGSISASTLAEVNTLSLDGYANGNVGGSSTFRVNIGQAGSYRLAFDASLTMQTTEGGTATSQLSVSITGGTGGDYPYFAPDMNRTISGNSSVSTGTLSYFTDATVLSTGFRNFTIEQNSTVSASVIPEPSSIAIFGLMSVGSLAAWRRRRAGERKSAEA